MHDELRTEGVRVHVVSPSNTDTPLHNRFFPDEDPATLIAPEEIAAAVVFLAESEGKGIIRELRVTRMRQ